MAVSVLGLVLESLLNRAEVARSLLRFIKLHGCAFEFDDRGDVTCACTRVCMAQQGIRKLPLLVGCLGLKRVRGGWFLSVTQNLDEEVLVVRLFAAGPLINPEGAVPVVIVPRMGNF